jgi:formyltetrahydrofolate synthetase
MLVLVGGGGIGVNVAVGKDVSVADGSAVSGANVEVTEAGKMVGVEAGEQAVNVKINMNMAAMNFFMLCVYSFFHSMNLISSISRVGSRVNLSLRPSRLYIL